MFAKLKTLLRKQDARSPTRLSHCVAALLDRFPPDECQNYLRHAGYASA